MTGIAMNITKLSSLVAIFLTPSALAESTFVVDAGSSGSRLFEYHYHYDESAKHDLPVIDREVTYTNIKGGVQDITPSKLEPYLEQLFGQTTTTPDHIYFYSTAGMRTISSNDRNKINQSVLATLTQRFPKADVKVKTITGQVEGTYAWLTANYINGAFSNNEITKGIIDLGGASTQISFESKIGDNLIDVAVGDLKFTLSSTSFLGLGQDLALKQYINEPACFPIDYVLPNGLQGTGIFSECVNKVEPLINGVHQVNQKQLKPENNTGFYAISGYFFTSKDLGITQSFNLSNLESKGKDFCSQKWQPTDQNGDDSQPNSYLYTNCFNAAYQHTLITQGYQLADDKTDIKAVEELNGNTISWTLGPILAPDL
ncbi:hypothetical protein F0225_11090 [Vibrio pectenicida]|uniref:Uncharacterized protein n=2 Tax=Vibrio pectenicida TaxID=62763 RepID=A0A7Y4A128_9VIBR|nr:hypothetical protein [Vibrio pectenicida]